MKLKSCPFCGSTNIKAVQVRKPLPDFEDVDGGDWLVRCFGCNSDHYFFFQNNVENAWNRRADNG